MRFYQGKTIILNVPTAAGAGFDIDTRFLVPQLESYLHATVDVVDYALGATIPGQNATAGAAPDGLTVGLLETGSDVVNEALSLPGLNFNPEHEVFLGGWPNTTGMLIDHVSNPYPTLLSLKQATTANPVTICEIQNNSTSLQINLVFKTLGIAYRPITGYANSTAEEAGWLRGDCNLVYVSYAGLVPYVKAGVGRALGITTEEPSTFVYYQQLLGVPLFTSVMASEKKKTAYEQKAYNYALQSFQLPTVAFVAPSATKSNRFLALRAAFKFALRSTAVKNGLSNRGEPQGYVSPETEKAAYVKASANMQKAATFAFG